MREFGLHVLGAVLTGMFSMLVLANAEPPLLPAPDKEFAEVSSLSLEQISALADDSDLLRRTYKQALGTIRPGLGGRSEWETVVNADIERRGERVQGVLEGLYLAEDQGTFQTRMLQELRCFTTIDNSAFVEICIEEIGNGESMTRRTITPRLIFVAEFGTPKDRNFLVDWMERNQFEEILVSRILERKVAGPKRPKIREEKGGGGEVVVSGDQKRARSNLATDPEPQLSSLLWKLFLGFVLFVIFVLIYRRLKAA